MSAEQRKRIGDGVRAAVIARRKYVVTRAGADADASEEYGNIGDTAWAVGLAYNTLRCYIARGRGEVAIYRDGVVVATVTRVRVTA